MALKDKVSQLGSFLRCGFLWPLVQLYLCSSSSVSQLVPQLMTMDKYFQLASQSTWLFHTTTPCSLSSRFALPWWSQRSPSQRKPATQVSFSRLSPSPPLPSLESPSSLSPVSRMFLGFTRFPSSAHPSQPLDSFSVSQHSSCSLQTRNSVARWLLKTMAQKLVETLTA